MIILKYFRDLIQFIQDSWPFKLFNQLSLKNKLLISFIFVSIIPILFVQTVSYYNSTISIKTKINELIHFNLVQTAKIIDTTLASYKDLVIQIFSNDNLIAQFKKLNSNSDLERLIAANRIRDEFNILSHFKPGVKCISILAASGEVAWYDNETNTVIHNIWSRFPDVTNTEVYRNAIHSEGLIFTTTDTDRYGGKDSYFINIALKIFDWKDINKECLGVIVLSFNEDYLYNSCNQTNNDPNGTGSFNFIYDNQGRIISFPNKSYLGKRIFPHLQTKSTGELNHRIMGLIKQAGVFKGRRFIINQLQLKENGWMIVNVIDQNYLFNQMYWMQRLNIIFGILAILFSMIIITYVTSTLSQSIKKIVLAMNIARKGELSIQVDLDTKDEISMIGSHFNKMMVQLQQLIEEKKLATDRQKEAEITALVAQINPHFLYNTLDSINWMAIEKEEYEISHMLKKLAEILRYSINGINQIVTIREEVEWLKQYIYLQQNRFEHSFESIVEFEETIMDCKIFKLLLQPMIENSIIHGFEGCTDGGILTIKGILEEQSIKISIKDNGKGIPPETLGSINHDIQETISSNGTGIGIKNVINRLRIYYGENAKLNFISQVGVGTTVILILPLLKDQG